MREYRLHDIAIYSALALWYMANNYPLINVAEFFFNNSTFFARLILDIIIKGFIEPLDVKDNVSQKGTLYQHILVRIFRVFLPRIGNFCQDDPCFSFLANDVWKQWFQIRGFLQCHNGVDMTRYEEADGGLWIRKNFRDTDHDLIVFYVPNIAILRGQHYVYLEYLATLHGLLMLQGFDNPAIYVCSIPKEINKWDYNATLQYIHDTWQKVTSLYDSKWVIYGDSIGANLVQSFLVTRQPSALQPTAAILCSPIPTWTIASRVRRKTPNLDFINAIILERVFTRYFPEEHPVTDVVTEQDSNPDSTVALDIDAWKAAMPERGMVLIWGESEYLAEEIQRFGSALSECGRVKLLKRADSIHCWPMLSFLTEDVQEEKEAGCFALAGIISRMVLWNTGRYLDPQHAREPMNVLTIDDAHL